MSDTHSSAHAAPAGHAHAAAHAAAHGHADHGHAGPHWSHAISPKLLLGTFAVLILLTFLTVSATSVNLGWTFNLVVAMVIATIKALLVALFFMHLAFDKGFNGMIFMGSVVFASVFVLIALMDTGSYQDLIIEAAPAEAAPAEAAPADAPPAEGAAAEAAPAAAGH